MEILQLDPGGVVQVHLKAMGYVFLGNLATVKCIPVRNILRVDKSYEREHQQHYGEYSLQCRKMRVVVGVRPNFHFLR